MENKVKRKKFYQNASKPSNYVPSALVTTSPDYPPIMSGLMQIDPVTKDIWISAGRELVTDWINIASGGGGGGTYTASNGLTETPANNFKLGGTLTDPDTFILTGVNNLGIIRSGGAVGVAGPPFLVYSDDGNFPAAQITSIDNTALGSAAFQVVKLNSSPIADEITLSLAASQFTPGISRIIDIGKTPNAVNSTANISFTFLGGAGGSNAGNTNIISAKVYDISNNNYRADLEFFTAFGTTQITPPPFETRQPIVTKKMSITGNGQLILDEYGSAAFNGAVSYLLAVDTSGNVKEVTTAGLTNAINDAAAQAAGVPVNGIYRNGSALQIRVV
jgi:hypothetical protein